MPRSCIAQSCSHLLSCCCPPNGSCDSFESKLASLDCELQGVHMLFECMPDRQWHADEKRYCKMVFIGRDLDKEMIREGFKECLVE